MDKFYLQGGPVKALPGAPTAGSSSFTKGVTSGEKRLTHGLKNICSRGAWVA